MNEFTGYEYRDVTVKRGSMALYADNYQCFGWTLENTGIPIGGINSVTMRFKRNRKLRNMAELTRLQRQFEAGASEIETLEQSKGLRASIAAYVIGVAGTAFMAGSVFALMAGLTALSIVLAIPAIAGWIAPYFCYVHIRRRSTENVTPVIDGKYDEIYEVCEKAHGLIAS